MTETVSVHFLVEGEADPGLLPRLLQPFARRDLTPDSLRARRRGGVVEVEIALEAAPAEAVPLIAGNLGQVVGVSRVEARRRAAARAAA